MGPFVCPSPVIIDHSFPRNQAELRRAAVALGELERLVDQGRLEILITGTLQEFMQLFDCGVGDRPYALLHDLYALLDAWILTMPQGVVRVNVSDVVSDDPHPVPMSCSNEGLVDMWSEELGRLLIAHDQESPRAFFIGVACETGFSGGPVGGYRPPHGRAFPLIGPEDLAKLEDSREWITLPDVHMMEVSFASAKQNAGLLGATKVSPPSGGSHYIVSFPNRRSWALDRNVDPVPERFLRQLVAISGFPLPVIKTVLITGNPPESRVRLQERHY